MKVPGNAVLRDREVGHPGCGAGTENACFALTRGGEGWFCLGKVAETGDVEAIEMFQMVGIQLGWRVNIDETDRLAWCPLGVLNNSKRLPPAIDQQ